MVLGEDSPGTPHGFHEESHGILPTVSGGWTCEVLRLSGSVSRDGEMGRDERETWRL